MFDRRLQRDGWIQEDPGGKKADPPESWRRSQPTGAWQVVRRLHGVFHQHGGVTRTYIESFAVRSPDGKREIPLESAEWEDWDRRGRLLLARGGSIIAAKLDPDGQITERVLADLNSAAPGAIVAPEAAQHW
jgi:hypothetical protein